MAKEVIGTCPSTGEVLVRDTETGEQSWEPGTGEQIDRVTVDIEATPPDVTPDYEDYEAPPPGYVPPPVPPPVLVIAFTYREVPPEAVVEAPEEVSALSVSVDFIGWIIERFNFLSEDLYAIYLEVLSWMWPFYNVSYLFYYLAAGCSQIAWGFYDFSLWIVEVHDRIQQVLTWSTIWAYILSYVPNLVDIRDWFYDWPSNIYGVVTDWWSSTSSEVLSWIDEAKSYAATLVAGVDTWLGNLQATWDDFWTITWPEWMSNFDAVKAGWDNFWTQTFPTLATWTGVDNLIDSTIRAWLPFYDDLASLVRLWGEIEEFFSDPLQWLYNKMDEWFERFW